MLVGRRFHSTVVLGRKENLKQSFLEVGCLKEIEDDLRVEIPPSDLVWYWSVSIATFWLTALYSRDNLETPRRSSKGFQPTSLDVIAETLDLRRKSLQANLAAWR